MIVRFLLGFYLMLLFAFFLLFFYEVAKVPSILSDIDKGRAIIEQQEREGK